MKAMETGRPAQQARTARGAGPSRRLALSKYEGLGNDFLVLVASGSDAAFDAQLARAACDRHQGFGADGLLELGPAQGGADISMQLRNADGSEAEMSGNGLRCLVHAALDAGVAKAGPGDSIVVATPAGPRRVTVHDYTDGWLWASAEMGSPVIEQGGEICNVHDGQALVNVGNPHLVVLGPSPAGLDLATLGPALGRGERNVELVALGPGPDELTMRIWERGVGETRACGTGSVAAAVAAHHWGRVGRKVTVHQPGGAAEVELRPDGVALLSGPSRRVGQCWLEL